MDLLVPLLGGFVLLVLGGELLVRGAVRVAERLGMSPLLIGLTLVGFGTSMPELVTSVQAARAGSPGIAVGNIVGSNIANILLVRDRAACLLRMAVPGAALRCDGARVVGTAAMLAFLGLVGPLDRVAGAVFLTGLAVYLVYAWREERAAVGGHTAAFERAEALREVHPQIGSEADTARPGWLLPLGMALAGLVLVVLGGRFLVEGAIGLARNLGVSESVIGLTIVAVGTSLPELVTSVVAALRRHADVSLGNVLGSCIYNVLGIGGITGLISPTVVPPEIARFDSPVMVAASVLLLVFAWTGLRIGRREGACLLAGYVAYVWAVWPH